MEKKESGAAAPSVRQSPSLGRASLQKAAELGARSFSLGGGVALIVDRVTVLSTPQPNILTII